MEYNWQLLHEICLQENWGFPVLFFSWLEKTVNQKLNL